MLWNLQAKGSVILLSSAGAQCEGRAARGGARRSEQGFLFFAAKAVSFMKLLRLAVTNNPQALADETGEGFQNVSVDVPMNFPRVEFMSEVERLPTKAGPDGDGAPASTPAAPAAALPRRSPSAGAPPNWLCLTTHWLLPPLCPSSPGRSLRGRHLRARGDRRPVREGGRGRLAQGRLRLLLRQRAGV